MDNRSMSQRSQFRFADSLRVRWAEIDMQKIVFNGHYLTYIDTAVGGYWRALALPYEEAMAQLAGDLFVRKATLEYHAPAEYDDRLAIGIRCDRIGNSSMQFAAGVFRDQTLLVSAELVYVFADPVARQPRPVPGVLRQLLEDFEAGRPMVGVEVGGWDALGASAQAIRTEVFVHEQGIPASLEWDSADSDCLHALARNQLGMAVGTGRLLVEAPGVGKIGRMAVRRSVRGSQVGRAVLDALIGAARQRGDHEVMLHAQTSAAAFYTRAGFSTRGPVFEEAGIPHVEMVKALG
jgi:YbgC/YbaW family acyl-CoA thioester hydrolase